MSHVILCCAKSQLSERKNKSDQGWKGSQAGASILAALDSGHQRWDPTRNARTSQALPNSPVRLLHARAQERWLVRNLGWEVGS